MTLRRILNPYMFKLAGISSPFNCDNNKSIKDIAVNLTDPVFRGSYRGRQIHEDDLDQVLKRAQDLGIVRMMITGGSLSESLEAIALAKQFSHLGVELKTTAGCHPTRCLEPHTQGATEYFAQLERCIDESRGFIGALGECGLDYDRLEFCPKEVQLLHLPAQLEMASKKDLALFLHCRNAAPDLLGILKGYPLSRGVVHSFTGSLEEMREFVKLGFYIGINGCSLKTEDNVNMVKHVPLERLMLETDAPWCDIRPTHASFAYLKDWQAPSIFSQVVKKPELFFQGQMVKSRNEPCQLRKVLRVVAQLKGVKEEEVAKITWENTEKMFFSV